MPTCPFRTAQDIKSAWDLYLQKEARCLYSVSAFSHTPHNALVIAEDGTLTPMVADSFGRKTQEQPEAFRPNGAIFLMDRDTMMKADSLFVPPMYPYVMTEERSIDIDNPLDLAWAEFMLKQGVISDRH